MQEILNTIPRKSERKESLGCCVKGLIHFLVEKTHQCINGFAPKRGTIGNKTTKIYKTCVYCFTRWRSNSLVRCSSSVFLKQNETIIIKNKLCLIIMKSFCHRKKVHWILFYTRVYSYSIIGNYHKYFNVTS